ncbi:MAG: DUF2799 domain-containing protein [Steroidobacteraceae bacterium]
MSKNECLTVDWRTVGYEDGVDGYSPDRIAEHRKACAKYGVSTDLALYQQGREQGLQEYCKPANGYRIGVRGGAYPSVCPVALEPAFGAAFDSGHQLYVLESRVSNADAQIDYRRRELNQIEHGIAANAAEIVSNDSTPKDRADALVDTAQMAERIGRLKGEIRQLEEDRVRYERDLESYRAGQAPIS